MRRSPCIPAPHSAPVLPTRLAAKALHPLLIISAGPGPGGLIILSEVKVHEAIELGRAPPPPAAWGGAGSGSGQSAGAHAGPAEAAAAGRWVESELCCWRPGAVLAPLLALEGGAADGVGEQCGAAGAAAVVIKRQVLSVRQWLAAESTCC